MNHGPGFKGFVTCLQSGPRHQLEVGAHNITYLGVSNPSETHLFLVIYRFYRGYLKAGSHLAKHGIVK